MFLSSIFIRIVKIYTLLFAFLLSLNSYSSIMLLKEPNAISFALADAISSTWIKNYGDFDNFKTYKLSGYKANLGLCSEDMIMSADPEVYTDKCKAVDVINYEGCKNSKGCVALEVGYDVVENSTLNSMLRSTLSNPCKNLDDIAYHFSNYYYPFSVSREVLNCEGSDKPYNKVILKFGNDIDTIEF